MPREISAGGVVVRHMQGRWWMAAIEPAHEGVVGGKTVRSVLALPKGIVDPGEKPAETAIREVREETGLEAHLVRKLKDIKYMYVRTYGDGQRVFKIVSFYLLRYRSGRIGEIHQEMKVEVRNAFWIPLAEAAQKLTYRGEREVVGLAWRWVEANPELPPETPPTRHKRV